jgi:hypothetical protein
MSSIKILSLFDFVYIHPTIEIVSFLVTALILPEPIPSLESGELTEQNGYYEDGSGEPPSPEDEAVMLDAEADEEKKPSLWLLIALALLALLLIWIILGVWRYLQVLGYGGF